MIRIFSHYISLRKVLFVAGQGLLILLSVAISISVLNRSSNIANTLYDSFTKIFAFLIVMGISFYFNGLHNLSLISSKLDYFTRVVRSIGLAVILQAILYAIWPTALVDGNAFFSSFVPLLLFLLFWRYIYAVAIRRRILTRKLLILGDGKLARDILHELKCSDNGLSYKVSLLVIPNESKTPTNNRRTTVAENVFDMRFVTQAKYRNSSDTFMMTRLEDALGRLTHYIPSHTASKEVRTHLETSSVIPIYAGFSDLCRVAGDAKVDSVVVALDEKRGIMPYKQLLECKMRGIQIIEGEEFYEMITGKLLAEKINPSWLIFSEGFKKSRLFRIVKRLGSLIISTTLFLLLLPLMVLVAIAIKVESHGSILFSQERVGEFGKIFTLYKFRSMRSDAETSTGPVWAAEDDPRVTKVGKVIRKFRIDELPQLWNVFKGDMSIVGPRPERPFFVEGLKKKIPYYSERSTVKPGVTGWAQVRYPYCATEEDALEKLKYDLYYIKNMSVMLDLTIILTTIRIVLMGKGAR